MDIKNCCRSGRRSVRLGRYYQEIEPHNLSRSMSSASSTTSNKFMSSWKVLWMKLTKKEKLRKIFESATASIPQGPYDPYTYSQNFDQGSLWDEPDNLSRSFSVRFSDSSRLFLKKDMV